MGPTWARNIPANIVFLCSYEYLQKLTREAGHASYIMTAVNGGIGGLIYWYVLSQFTRRGAMPTDHARLFFFLFFVVLLRIVSYPADLVKSRMQTDHVDHDKRRFKNMVDCAKAVYSGALSKDPVPTVGIKNFYRGLTPCLMRAFPANAIGLLTYEYIKQIIMTRKKE
jgi:solute carrier family 25 (mitochondrial carnitine/acylcarnitine transporter), member 20/29